MCYIGPYYYRRGNKKKRDLSYLGLRHIFTLSKFCSHKQKIKNRNTLINTQTTPPSSHLLILTLSSSLLSSLFSSIDGSCLFGQPLSPVMRYCFLWLVLQKQQQNLKRTPFFSDEGKSFSDGKLVGEFLGFSSPISQKVLFFSAITTI